MAFWRARKFDQHFFEGTQAIPRSCSIHTIPFANVAFVGFRIFSLTVYWTFTAFSKTAPII
jgi:hypothetical protein